MLNCLKQSKIQNRRIKMKEPIKIQDAINQINKSTPQKTFAKADAKEKQNSKTQVSVYLTREQISYANGYCSRFDRSKAYFFSMILDEFIKKNGYLSAEPTNKTTTRQSGKIRVTIYLTDEQISYVDDCCGRFNRSRAYFLNLVLDNFMQSTKL